MAYEIPGPPLKLNDGTIRKPRFRVYDQYGNENFSVDRAVFSLKRKETAAEILRGDSDEDPASILIENNDTDRAGNTIKTVTPVLDLTDTDLEIGSYLLSLHFYLSNGEDDVVRQPVQVVEYTGV